MEKIIGNLIDEIGDSNFAIRDRLISLSNLISRKSLKGKTFLPIDLEKMREFIGIKKDTSIIETERIEVEL